VNEVHKKELLELDNTLLNWGDGGLLFSRRRYIANIPSMKWGRSSDVPKLVELHSFLLALSI